MSAISYELFYPYIQPHVAGCPDPSLLMAVRGACIEFCEQTNYFNETFADVQVLANTNNYEMDVQRNYVLVDVLELYVSGLKLVKKSSLELEKLYGMFDWQTVEGQPKFFTRLNTAEVVLVPKPTEVGELSGRFSYAPSRTSTTVEESLFEDYAEVIAQGALSKIYMHPGQNYTSPAMALSVGREFMSGIANAKAYVKGGMSASTPMRVRFMRNW